MTQQYSIDEARSHLDEIISAVEQGNSVEITRSGKRIAVLISSEVFDRFQPDRQADFWQSFQVFQREFNVKELGIESDLFAGLRDGSAGREVSW